MTTRIAILAQGSFFFEAGCLWFRQLHTIRRIFSFLLPCRIRSKSTAVLSCCEGSTRCSLLTVWPPFSRTTKEKHTTTEQRRAQAPMFLHLFRPQKTRVGRKRNRTPLPHRVCPKPDAAVNDLGQKSSTGSARASAMHASATTARISPAVSG